MKANIFASLVITLLLTLQLSWADSFPMSPVKDNLCPASSTPGHKTIKLNQGAIDKLMDKLEALDKEVKDAVDDFFDEINKDADEYAKNKENGIDDDDERQKILKESDEKMQAALKDYFLKSTNDLSTMVSPEKIEMLLKDYDKLSDAEKKERRDLQKALFEDLGYLLCDHRTQYGIQAATICSKHPKGIKIKEYLYESDPGQDPNLIKKSSDYEGLNNVGTYDNTKYNPDSDPWLICLKRMGFKVYQLYGGKNAKQVFEGSLPEADERPCRVAGSGNNGGHIEMSCNASTDQSVWKTGTTQGRDKPAMTNGSYIAHWVLNPAETLTPEQCAKRDNAKLSKMGAPLDLFTDLDSEIEKLRAKTHRVLGEGLRASAAAAGEIPSTDTRPASGGKSADDYGGGGGYY